MDSKNTQKTEYTYLAVDVAKASLQLQNAQRVSFALSYEARDMRKIVQQAKAQSKQTGKPALVIFEATGGYERKLRAYLEKAGVLYRMINPDRVRKHAGSLGIKAKTDKIDGRVLLDFAQKHQIEPSPPTDEKQVILAALLDRRRQIIDQITQDENRIQNCDKTMQPSLKRSIRFQQKEKQRIEEQISKHINKHPRLQQNYDRIVQIDGVGPVTAWSILAYMPEIAHITRNRAVALAGLAPFNNDSGKQNAKRQIKAGRAKLRKNLYMAAVCATVHNTHIRQYYQALIKRGKPAKCAIVAVMRKLILHIRSILISHQYEIA